MDATGLVVILAISASVSFLLTPAAMSFARRTNLLVRPRADRWGSRPTPLLGGTAIATGVLVALAVSLPLAPVILVVLLAGSMALALGLVDDFRHLSPSTKLVAEALIGAFVFFGGVTVKLVEFPPLAFVITVLWVVALMNAVNLIDNMDGLAAGVCGIAGAVLALSAVSSGHAAAAVIAAATAGAAAAFLFYNFAPARIFMGDSGSLFLGFMLAVAALLGTARGVADVGLALFTPLAILAVPIFDTALVTWSRRRAGLPVGRGGRDHTSHRLAAMGLTDRTAVLILYGTAAVLASIGLLANAIGRPAIPVVLLGFVCLVLFGVFVSEVDIYGVRRPTASDASRPEPTAHAIKVYGRFGAQVFLDVVLITTAYYSAFLLRYEDSDQSWVRVFVSSLPLLVTAQLGSLAAFGTYRILWRFLSVTDAFTIALAVSVGTAGAAIGEAIAGFPVTSVAVFVVDALVAASLMIGARAFGVWLRHVITALPKRDEKRVVIVGASDLGLIALRALHASAETRYRVVAFLDDDAGKHHRRIGGVSVVAGTRDFVRVVQQHQADLVVLADRLDPAIADELRSQCESMSMQLRVLVTFSG